jgi:alanyl aminopeptidase
LRYAAGSSTATQCVLLSDPKQSIALEKTRSCPAWITADADAAGYYRVLYEGDLGSRLGGVEALTLAERVNLLRSTQTLFEAGLIGPDEALPIAVRFASFDNRDIVQAAINIFGSARMLVAQDQKSAFAHLVGRSFADRARKLGWRPAVKEDDETRLLRSSLLRAVLNWGNEKDLDAEARNQTLTWLSDRTALDPGVAPSIVFGAATKCDKELFIALRTAADELSDVTERGIVTGALGSVLNPQIARAALQWVLTTKRPPNERMNVLFGIGMKPETAPVMWEFVQQNYSTIVGRLPDLMSIDRGTLIIEMLAGLCTARARQEVQTFFAERSATLSGGPRALAQTLEKIDLCVARRTAQEPAMARYLQTVKF